MSRRCAKSARLIPGISMWFSAGRRRAYRIRSLQPADGFAIHEFGSQLRPEVEVAVLPVCLGRQRDVRSGSSVRVIERTVSRIDASYL